jgi:hypothetical protein
MVRPLIAILLKEDFVEYQCGGAMMWPLAQFFGGTIPAATGVVAFYWAKKKFAE